MKDKRKTKQRVLQLSFAVCLIVFVLAIEFVAKNPPGIYSYAKEGYKEFKIGFSKQSVLKKINKRRAIRTIRVCDPDSFFELTSRKRFQLEEELFLSDYWICHDRTGKDFLFLFKAGVLERILLQRIDRDKELESSLFSDCNTVALKKIDTYLVEQEKLNVFYD